VATRPLVACRGGAETGAAALTVGNEPVEDDSSGNDPEFEETIGNDPVEAASAIAVALSTADGGTPIAGSRDPDSPSSSCSGCSGGGVIPGARV
jgi:hypothetical protein